MEMFEKCNSKIYYIIIKACVLSIFRCCDMIMINCKINELKILNAFHHKPLGYLTGARHDTPIDELLLIAGDMLIFGHFEISAAKYWFRLLPIPNNNPVYRIIEGCCGLLSHEINVFFL